ncbi:MAG TPA: DinB family protein [Candidatus Kapabacteria bacterium]|nr:DinB family protein [Candidatus Kapabacteria bacterium]HOM05320.1 DinB family protein [Candidatus Kapabacteria bacterium]
MYSTINDFISDWAQESSATSKLFQLISNDSLKQKVYSEGRTLGTIVWHIVYTVGEMMSAAGIQLPDFDLQEKMPSDINTMIDKYYKYSNSLIEAIKNFDDSKLNEEYNIYGENWKFRDLLKGLVYHQIHHRGQLTVLMRQAGLPVIGIYGPSKEEWKQFGMEAPE